MGGNMHYLGIKLQLKIERYRAIHSLYDAPIGRVIEHLIDNYFKLDDGIKNSDERLKKLDERFRLIEKLSNLALLPHSLIQSKLEAKETNEETIRVYQEVIRKAAIDLRRSLKHIQD